MSLRGSARQLRLLASATALAAALSLAERLLPLPVPWIKPGLANLVVLVLLFTAGWRAALTVAVLKTFVVALFLGGLFAPGHLFALSGALAATVVMAGAARLPLFSLYGISAAGAWAHSIAQLACGRLLFFSTETILSLAVPLLLFSLAAGLLTGALAAAILPRLRSAT